MEMYSPAAMENAPAKRPATPVSKMMLGSTAAPATPITRHVLETSPSLAPTRRRGASRRPWHDGVRRHLRPRWAKVGRLPEPSGHDRYATNLVGGKNGPHGTRAEGVDGSTAMMRARSGGAKTGICVSSVARILAWSSAACAIWRKSAAFAESFSAAATEAER